MFNSNFIYINFKFSFAYKLLRRLIIKQSIIIRSPTIVINLVIFNYLTNDFTRRTNSVCIVYTYTYIDSPTTRSVQSGYVSLREYVK